MANSILTASDSMSHEYCASVVRIGEVTPIEGSDYLGKVVVEGFSIVVRKDEVKEGDIMFYAANETQLSDDFLRVNNQYELSERERNDNYKEVEALLEESASELLEAEKHKFEASKDGHSEEELNTLNAEAEAHKAKSDELQAEAKSKVGFFNKRGRVKMITLRKCPSYGYLFGVDAMAKYCPKILDEDLAAIVDNPDISHDFDTVDGNLFIQVYVPPMPSCPPGTRSRTKQREKKLKRFDRMIPGQFAFHYDTDQLNKCIRRISPTDQVTISVKLHGTSFIAGNILVKVPHAFNTRFGWLNDILDKMYAQLPQKWQKTTEEYGNVYSSRTVIKNQFINAGVTSGFYATDVWGEYSDLLKPYIDKGMTIYGEIVGYVGGASDKMIQKGYDYGCAPGTNKLMVYRITTAQADGTKFEWEVDEVKQWTEHMIAEHEELKDKLHPIDIVWDGTLQQLYPDISVSEHWHENVLESLKHEPRFLMEKNEPLCKNKVPREGLVFRIAHDPVKEAFKLKTDAFMKRESKEMDAGNVDVEMAGKYAEA